MRFDHYHHFDDVTTGLNTKLDQVLSILRDLKKQGVKEMAVLDGITAQVKANKDAEASAIALLTDLAAKLAAAAADPVAVQALSDELKASADALGAAIVANTPAA